MTAIKDFVLTTCKVYLLFYLTGMDISQNVTLIALKKYSVSGFEFSD